MNISNEIQDKLFKTFGFCIKEKENPLPEITAKICAGNDLDKKDVVLATTMLMSSEVQSGDIAAYLSALHKKGETSVEIAASAEVMRLFAAPVYEDALKECFSQLETIDCCGTGGGLGLFNISTITAFILAASGLYVAKHGNRAITSSSGSADFLESLGANLNVPAEKTGQSIIENHIGFLFAPVFHKATKNVQLIRRTLSHKTIFNILGPMTNPAKPAFQTVGVYEPCLTEKLAEVLKILGLKDAAVMHGFTPCGTGMDEVSIFDNTKVSEFTENEKIKTYFFNPEEIGIRKAKLSDFSDKKLCKPDYILEILNGKINGPHADIIALNAAFGLKTGRLVRNIKQGADLARDIMISGKCNAVINSFVNFTKRF